MCAKICTYLQEDVYLPNAQNNVQQSVYLQVICRICEFKLKCSDERIWTRCCAKIAV